MSIIKNVVHNVVHNAINFQVGANVNQSPQLNYEPELLTYISGLSTPISTDETNKINTLISSVKSVTNTTSLSDFCDVFRIWGGENKEISYRNLAKDAHHATDIVAPTFSANNGIKGNATNMAVSSNYSPKTEGVNYKVNDACIGIFTKESVNVDSGRLISMVESSVGVNINIALRLTGDVISGLINQGGVLGGSQSNNSNEYGMFFFNKAQSGFSEIFKNKVSLGTRTATLDIIPAGVAPTLCRITDGTKSLYSSRQIALEIWSRSLTQTEINGITDAVSSFFLT